MGTVQQMSMTGRCHALHRNCRRIHCLRFLQSIGQDFVTRANRNRCRTHFENYRSEWNRDQ